MIKIPNQLQKLRDQIDIIDEKIINTLAKRTNIVRKVGEFKKENNIKPLDSKRFSKLLKEKLVKANDLNLPKSFIKDLYNLIHKHSLKIENKK